MTAITRKPITCLFCENVLGHSISINNTEFIEVGGILLQKVTGVCPHCGKMFYWSISDKQLNQVVEYIKKHGSNML